MTMTADTDPDGIMFLKHNSPAADDLVTEEMLDVAVEAIADPAGDYAQVFREELLTALRAVAPMIAERARFRNEQATGLQWNAAWVSGARAEREAIAKIVKATEDWDDCLEASNHILAAIRARGETPPKPRPGEIDWSAMDRED
jgi:hypothetical protein